MLGARGEAHLREQLVGPPPPLAARRAGGASAASTFWRAVSVGIRLNCWKMNPMVVRLRRARSPSPMRASGLSSKRPRPPDGRSSAPSSWSTVVLPEPLGPTIATYSPPAISRLVGATATTCVAPSP